jgi:UDP-glucose 4-epimerase
MKKNILITGGAGFIGGKLAWRLKAKGFKISIIDFKHKIKAIHKKNYDCYGFDLSKKDWINKIKKKFEYVFHIAAQSGGRYSLDNPQIDCLWNCLATVNVVEFCKKIKPKKLIYTSSMAVYGNVLNATEITPPNPMSYYGVSKLAGEGYVKLLFEHCKIPYTIYRLFATYGSGQDLENKQQGIVSIYIKLAMESDTVGITGKKNRVRQIVHVEDVCNGIELAITNPKTNNQTYNILHDEICSPEKIIKMISKKFEKKLKIKELSGYVGDQTKITGVNKKLRRLGWKPTYTLEEGVEEFLDGIKFK